MKAFRVKQRKFLGSKEHQTFVKKEKTKTFFVHFSRIALLFAILGFWELVAYKNWVDPFIISSPSRNNNATRNDLRFLVKHYNRIYFRNNSLLHNFY